VRSLGKNVLRSSDLSNVTASRILSGERRLITPSVRCSVGVAGGASPGEGVVGVEVVGVAGVDFAVVVPTAE